MLKYIISGIFIALIWTAVFVFRGVDFLFWGAIVLTPLIVGGLLTYVVVRALSDRRSAGVMDDSIKKSATATGLRPDQRSQILAMQDEFQQAIAKLKASRLGAKGRNALGILPWYIIIGPPGAGKTTALQSSGLQFPYAKGGKVKGVGGTRNCDWWLANEAIILDTAGRWTVQDEDRDEWLSFLKLLRKARPKKPINGILIAISLTDLTGAEDEMVALHKALRERMDEVIGHLDMVVPVYLLLTKMDLVPGFVETYSDLRDKERGQVWGVTLPFLASHEERADRLKEGLAELFTVAATRAISRVHSERRADARFSIFGFPQQVATIQDNLMNLVSELFVDNVYQDAPVLRGVYLTSGTQEGRTIDRIMQKMASAFGVDDMTEGGALVRPKSYFLREVFTHVVFPDQNAAVKSTRALRRQQLQMLGLAALCFVIAAGSLLFPIRSYLSDSNYVSEVASFIDKVSDDQTERKAGWLPSSAALDSVETFAQGLHEQGTESSILFPRNEVTSQLHLAIERLIALPILRHDLAKTISPGGLSSPELMNALILHLLLTQEKQPDEPAPGTKLWKNGVKLASAMAHARWNSISPASKLLATSKAPKVVEDLITYYAERIQDPAEMIEREKRFVTAARSTLLSINEDPLAEIISDPRMPSDLKAVDLLGSAILLFSRNVSADRKVSVIRGAFTPAGYQVVQQRLSMLEKSQEDHEDSWILGQELKVRDAKTTERIKANYYNQYITEWKRFLLSLALKEPTSVDEMRALLKTIATDKPFELIWKNVSQNLELQEEETLSDKALDVLETSATKKLAKGPKQQQLVKAAKKAHKGQPVEEEGPKMVAEAFDGLLRFGAVKPTGFEQYGRILNEVSSTLGEQGIPDIRNFQRTIITARSNLSNLIARYNDQGWEQGMLEKILMPPLLAAEVSVVGASADSANRKWCETVFVAFDQLVGRKYPFVRGNENSEAKIADIEKFFQPGSGTLWQYYTDSLQSDIEKVGGFFRLKEGASIRYRDEFLQFLNRAQAITTRLFSKDPAKIGFTVGVHILPSPQYSKIILDAGSKKIVGINALDRWEEFSWPSRRATLRLFVKSDEVDTIGSGVDGDWALFRLLAKAVNITKREEIISAQFPTAGGLNRIQIEFKPDFLPDLFHRFFLPRTITAGGGACRK